MRIEIKGQIYSSEYGFHNQLAKLIKLEKNYGSNPDALWYF